VSGVFYLEHLTDADLGLLAAASSEGESAGDSIARLRANPERLEGLLKQPAVFAHLFRADERDPLLRASPFLVFAGLVNRATQDLAQLHFVQEWVGPRQRVPVFDIAGLQEFAADSLRRFFLAQLLASYTRVASGSFWVHTSRGWRRRRFSELDPLRLIELLDIVPEHERAGVYRRLGDLTLFLPVVFPDYAGERLFRPIERERLQRTLARGEGKAGGTPGEDPSSAIWLLEQVGRRSYRMAWKATQAAEVGMARVLGDVSEGFGKARRILNFVTDRYLFPLRERWFPLAGA